LVWTLIVGSMDNVLRPILIRKGADLPLLLIFAGVLGGLVGFGRPWLFGAPAVPGRAYRRRASRRAQGTDDPPPRAPPRPPPRAMTRVPGAQASVRILKCHGASYISGLCGDTSVPLYDALYRLDHGIQHILARDERSAAYMADGYARVSGRVGVCEGPSGGG